MVTVETIGRIRRAFLVEHKPIRQIVRELRISRQTVRKAIRGSAAEFRYERQVQPQPRLGAFVARLDAMLEANSKRPVRERLTARRLFELLRAEGYEGAYDSVQRHVRDWRRQRSQQGPVFIPLWFAPGEAYQFDCRQGTALQPPLCGDVLASSGRTDRVHPTGQARGLKAHGGGLGERSGREPGRQRARAPVHAAAALCRLRRAECLSGGALPGAGARERAFRAEREDDLGGVPGRASQPDHLLRAV